MSILVLRLKEKLPLNYRIFIRHLLLLKKYMEFMFESNIFSCKKFEKVVPESMNVLNNFEASLKVSLQILFLMSSTGNKYTQIMKLETN